MTCSHSISGVVALTACLCWALLASATPSHAAEPLPDPQVLSAAPFEFHADPGIFSRMDVSPSDSRIFSPKRSVGKGGASQLPEAHLEHQKPV